MKLGRKLLCWLMLARMAVVTTILNCFIKVGQSTQPNIVSKIHTRCLYLFRWGFKMGSYWCSRNSQQFNPRRSKTESAQLPRVPSRSAAVSLWWLQLQQHWQLHTKNNDSCSMTTNHTSTLQTSWCRLVQTRSYAKKNGLGCVSNMATQIIVLCIYI